MSSIQAWNMKIKTLSKEFYKRIGSLVMVATLFLMSLPEVVHWQCQNGSACPPNCRMMLAAAHPSRNVPTCPKCSNSSSKTGLSVAGNPQDCLSGKCVLRGSAHPQPAATLLGRTFHLDISGTAPPRYTLPVPYPNFIVHVFEQRSNSPPAALIISVSDRAPPFAS